MCRIGKNKWRWTFQTLCSFLVFSSIFLSPTTKYVLIAMHIYYLCWTSGSLGLLEVIGLLHRAESTILNRHLNFLHCMCWHFLFFIHIQITLCLSVFFFSCFCMTFLLSLCFIKFSNLNLIKRTLNITNLVILILYRNIFINTFILIIKPNYSFSNNCKPSFISYQ